MAGSSQLDRQAEEAPSTSGIAPRAGNGQPASSMPAAGLSAMPSTPPAQEYESHWPDVLPELSQLARRRRKPPDLLVMRASQLDAGRLDTELQAMLREQFMRIFSLFQPRVILALQPELTLLLDFLVFRFSVWAGKPTPGSVLMNLRFRNELAVEGRPPSGQQVAGRTGIEGPGPTRWQAGAWGAATVLLRYAWTRLEQLGTAQRWSDAGAAPRRRALWAGLRWAEAGFRLVALANFLVFLRHGKYRSLLERALRMRLVYNRASMARAISFEYLNRQLVWHELSELLLFLLPLVNVARLKQLVLHRLPPLKAALLPGFAGGRQAAAQSSSGPSPGPPQHCPICNTTDITVPFSAVPCGHVFCYYCLRTHTASDPSFKCPVCATRVGALRRWRPPDPA